jgi:uncharacterized PurR-regulated membrane protein YhhQ (DUF165 family)
MIWLLAYLLTIPAANWSLGHVGDCTSLPCVLPVGFGLYAPSGVLWAGLALWLRDETQERVGRRWTLLAIGAGALLSLAVSDPFVAVASGLAFGVSEAADMLVYTPLREHGHIRAVVASNVVGSAVDSALFLALAFGDPWTFLPGQLAGKWEMTLLVVVGLWLVRRRPVAQEALA